MNNIRQEVIRLFSKSTVWICILLYLLAIKLLLLSNFNSGQIWNAYQMVAEITSRNNFNKVLVLISAIPMAASYCNDVTDNYLDLIILRSTIRRYTVSKVIISFCSSFFISSLSLTIYSLYFAIKCGVGESAIQSGVFLDFAKSKCPYLAVLAGIFLFSIVSAVYAVLGLCLSAYVSGRFAAMAAPMVINTFAEVIVKYVPGAINIFRIQVGNSAYHMGTIGTVIMSAMVCVGYMYAGYLLFHRRVRRRVTNEII